MEKKFPPKGFTLIELLVTIAIIGILASVVMVILVGTYANARDTKRVSEITQICTALQAYYQSHGHYPYVGCSYTGQDVSQQFGVYRDNSSYDHDLTFNVLQPFLSPEIISGKVPNDPSATDTSAPWSYFYDNYYDGTQPENTPGSTSCSDQGFQLLGYLENVNNKNFPPELPWGTWEGRGWWRACKDWKK